MKKILFAIMFMLTSIYAGFTFNTCSGSGSFEQQINHYNGDYENAITVGEIPKGIIGLNIQLKSTKDVDIRLYSDTNDKIVHWPNGILNKSFLETKIYKKTKITYSGYNGVNKKKGEEFIKIPSTTPTKMIMKAFGYEAGYATVSYSWTGKEGCTAPKSGEGNFTQKVLNKKTNLVGAIPSGLDTVYIELTSDKDIDIQLYAKDGTAIVSWEPKGLISGSGKQNITYHKMNIEWSGYDGINGQKGHEYIKISNKTSEILTMKVFGYQAGTAHVTYSWGSKNIQVCTEEYAPVCGITNPCPTGAQCLVPPIYKTFSNMCHLNVAKAKLAYEGQCKAYNENNASYTNTMTVQAKKVNCGYKKCFLIQEKGSHIWDKSDIKNFTSFEKGYQYTILAKITKSDPNVTDAIIKSYAFIKTLTKKPGITSCPNIVKPVCAQIIDSMDEPKIYPNTCYADLAGASVVPDIDCKDED